MDYQEFFRERYEREEDPWHFGTCPFEKIRHAAMIEFALTMRPRAALDLGAGEGHFLERLLIRAPGLRATGVELDARAQARCRTRLERYGADVIQADLLGYLASPAGDPFDVAICGDVLYYLTPEIVTEQVQPGLVRRLRPGGGLVVSYADVNDHQWTVDVFLGRFRLARQVYIKPVQDPPPWPWMVSLLVLEG
ncbi:MAG: class I SAM-dependent methyltransferase [Patescibacteria group bacterium]